MIEPVSRLLACPFCRELFREDEGIECCPECGLGLRPLASLVPDPAADRTGDEAEIPLPPLEPRLAWTHWGHGRGPLILLAVLGLAAFLAPWVELLVPEHRMLSGFALARTRAPWLWAGPVAWFVTIPLLATRRSRVQLLGVRLIASLFAAMTLVDVALLSVVRASSGRRVPVVFEWAWGLWASGAISILGIIIASRLGAPLWRTAKPDSGASPRLAGERNPQPSAAPAETTAAPGIGETLH